MVEEPVPIARRQIFKKNSSRKHQTVFDTNNKITKVKNGGVRIGAGAF